jgi:DNA-binding GntR family transcriptional regulator
MPKSSQCDAYALILEVIDAGYFKPDERPVESDLADRFGVSRTPVREALQRLEIQLLLERDGLSLIVTSLGNNQVAEFYIVRAKLECLATLIGQRFSQNGRA